MSLSQLNELLEEAVQRCQQFSDEADQAEDAAKTVEERIHTLGDTVEDKAGEAHALFQDALAKLKDAEDGIDGSSEKGRTDLHGVGARVEEVSGKLTTLLAAVKAASDELQQKKATLQSNVEGRLEQTDGHFQTATRKIDGLSSRVDERVGAASKAIEGLNAAVADTRSSLERARNQFQQELGELASAVQREVGRYVEAVGVALDQASEALVKCGNDVIDAHNDAVEILRLKLTEEAPTEVETSLTALKEAIAALGRLCEGQEQSIEHTAGAILAKVGEAIKLSEGLTPILAQASRLV